MTTTHTTEESMSRAIINRLRLADQIQRLDRVDAQLAKVAQDLRPQVQQARQASLKLTRGKNGLPELDAVKERG